MSPRNRGFVTLSVEGNLVLIHLGIVQAGGRNHLLVLAHSEQRHALSLTGGNADIMHGHTDQLPTVANQHQLV